MTHCRGARRDFGKHLLARDEKAIEIKHADVAELVDARDLKSLDGNVVWVRVPPPAPRFALKGYAWRSQAEIVRSKRVRHSLSEARATTDW